MNASVSPVRWRSCAALRSLCCRSGRRKRGDETDRACAAPSAIVPSEATLSAAWRSASQCRGGRTPGDVGAGLASLSEEAGDLQLRVLRVQRIEVLRIEPLGLQKRLAGLGVLAAHEFRQPSQVGLLRLRVWLPRVEPSGGLDKEPRGLAIVPSPRRGKCE